ncbi:hypothetical protein HHK36_030152 [Tetracentron sinense]|uniref:Pentatricopeptide repeat-containing protein n=1 Tax=Tetracentron sinense TaxID=13715 RepID=A0A834YAR0_TETSI|nr:hypothetical protein HHK36_030152 [Tetracentron sinense]
MLQTEKESLPDDESYDLVIGMLFSTDQIDAALKYLDLTVKSGYMVSIRVFTECVQSCVNKGRLDTLASIIERCKTMDQNKALCPSWNLCNYIADVAMQGDSSKLAYYALEFLAKWIARGENTRPPVLFSVDEGLVVLALGTDGRTHNATLLHTSWAILRHSLCQKMAPNSESYLGKIYAHASLGNLQRAFSTLHEFESAYGNSSKEDSPHLTLYIHWLWHAPRRVLRLWIRSLPWMSALIPEVIQGDDLELLISGWAAFGFDGSRVYFQLENLSRTDPPYNSVAALNCVILGCANIWDLDRAYQTFEAIGGTFGLTPDIHSYNALMYAFGKLKKTFEASRVFEHLTSLGVKPDTMSYSLLVDAHLINRDPKAVLSLIDEMVNAGFIPSKETLKKVRRRCVREFDYKSGDQVETLARKFKIQMGRDNRRDMLFNLEYSTAYP